MKYISNLNLLNKKIYIYKKFSKIFMNLNIFENLIILFFLQINCYQIIKINLFICQKIKLKRKNDIYYTKM